MSYNNGQSSQNATRNITGKGGAGALTISDGPIYDFGTQTVGSTSSYTFTVTNSGGVTTTAMASTGTIAAPYTFKGGTYPGTGGDCSTSLLAAATCTIVVDFSPTATGIFNETAGITYHDGSATLSATRDLTGVGALAVLTISDGATYDYGKKALGSVTSKSFTITNSGALGATVMADGSGLAAPFKWAGGTYPGTAGTCGATLAASATCTIVVDFSPTSSGVQSDTIVVSYNNGQSAQTSSRAVSGEGALAVLAISDGPTYDYAKKAFGSVTSKTFTITNSGAIGATAITDGAGLAAPYDWKGGTFPGTGGTCIATLAAAATCTVIVDFSPVSAAVFNDIIDISYNDGQGSQTASRAVTGEGGLALLTISDGATFDYGILVPGATGSKTFTVTNSGGVGATSMADGAGLAAPFNWKGGTYPGTAGTCGATLATSATCTIVVNFVPSAVAVYNDTILLNYNDGQAAQVANRAVTGEGSVAVITISDGATYDFGATGPLAPVSHTFTLTNSGGIGATAMADGLGLADPFTFEGGTYPGTAGTCGTTLAAAATCTIIVNFTPTVAGDVSNDTIDISYNDGVTTQHATRDVTGRGGAGILTISDAATYSYGNVFVGATGSKTFTITNTGTDFAINMADGLGLAAPYTFKGGTYPGTGGDCSTDLDIALTCTIVVDFAPSATGTLADTIEIAYNDGSANQSALRAVTGVGQLAMLSISDGATYDYGSKAPGTVTSKTFTITNTGNYTASSMAAAAGLSAPINYKGGTYPGTAGTCSTSLAAAGTCTVIVDFSPVATGAFSKTITINYANGVTTFPATRAVIGSGAVALLAISDSPLYDFGFVGSGNTVSKTFTITNSGGLAATVVADGLGLAAPYSFKGATYPGTAGTCSTSLAAAATCTVVVDFAPVAVATYNDTMTITYNDGVSGQTLSENVTGIGGLAILTITDSPTYNFGAVVNNQVAERTFTITNSGTQPATSVADGSGLAAPFRYKGSTYPGTGGTCGVSIAVSATCTIVLEYAPTATGTPSDTLIINYDDSAQMQVLNLGVAGTSGPPALLTSTDSPTYDYGNVNKNTTSSRTFTVTNTGGVPATVMADGAGLAAPFNWKGGTYPGTAGTCAATLAAAATCTVVVDFAPTAITSSSDAYLIGYNDGVTTQTLSEGVQGAGINTAPTVAAQSLTFYQGTSGNVITLVGTDVNLDALTYSVVAAPTNGTVGSQDGDASFTYSPTGAYTGADSFTVRANDGLVNSATATITIQVDPWWNASWKRRRKVTFDNSTVASNLTDFPVLVKITSATVDYSQTQNSGQDLRFIDSDNATVLSYEIEKWDEAGTSLVWVKVPQVNASSNTDHIYMYYGNAAAPAGQSASAVWSNGYLAVYHFIENAATTNISDSTSNARTLSPSGGGSNPTQDTTTSVTGNSIRFPGGTAKFMQNTSNFFNGLAAFTISFSVKVTATGTSNGFILTNSSSSATGGTYMGHRATNKTWRRGYMISGTGRNATTASNKHVTAWQHAAMTWTSATYTRLYLDGALDASTGTASTGTTTATTFRVGQTYGNYNATLASNTVFNGLMDELRVSNVARSADWIKAEQKTNTDNFYCSYAAEITIP